MIENTYSIDDIAKYLTNIAENTVNTDEIAETRVVDLKPYYFDIGDDLCVITLNVVNDYNSIVTVNYNGKNYISNIIHMQYVTVTIILVISLLLILLTS